MCPTVCHSTDCCPPGFFVHGILQARILEWVAIPFSKRPSQPRDQTLVSCITGRFLTFWATGKSWKSASGQIKPHSKLINNEKAWESYKVKKPNVLNCSSYNLGGKFFFLLKLKVGKYSSKYVSGLKVFTSRIKNRVLEVASIQIAPNISASCTYILVLFFPTLP